MSQFDWGTMDPYVVDGVQLADDLNQWRDALNTLHAGSTRPAYVKPGMLWINTAGGASAWVLSWYVSPTVGDVALFTLNSTTGAITISAAAGGTLASAILLAQAAANPQVQWNATGNPIDVKNWRMTVNGAGALVLASYNDAGVQQQAITFNRDGSIGSPSPMFRRLGRVVPTAGQPSVDFQNIPSDINDIELRFDVTPATNGGYLYMQLYDGSGALVTASSYTSLNNYTRQGAAVGASVTSFNTPSSNLFTFMLNAASQGVSTTYAIAGDMRMNNIRDATRNKYWQYSLVMVEQTNTDYTLLKGGGALGQNLAVSGLHLSWNTGNFKAGGAVSLWGSP
jgi:hypothetical protein